jgi:hypothetical protein
MKDFLRGLDLIVLLVLLAVSLPIGIGLFMVLWNSTIPAITGWQEIDFVQAVALLIIGRALTN